MRHVLAVKLRRDLRASWSRFVLMVVAIAVSLTVAGAVLMAWTAIGRETERAYLATAPASATIVLEQGIDAERMAMITAQVRGRAQVIDATGRTQFDSPVEVDGRTLDNPLQVFAAAPDDPMHLVRFDVGRDGSWPPRPDEILLGRDSLTLLGVAIGDTMTLTPPGGRPTRVRVAGTVDDPSLSPSPQEQRGRGYLSTTALSAPPARLEQVKIQVADPGQTTPSRDRAAIVTAASQIGVWLQRDHGLAVREIQVPEPYAHPHQWQSDAILGSLLAGAAAALLLAAILVAVMLNTLFTQQIPQIGILKAIGARSLHIGRFYLTMTLVVAAAATLLALGPAVLLARGGVALFAGALGVEPASLSPAAWTYPVIVAAGLILPPLMAMPPLIGASRTTVRAAIDHHGGTVKPGAATGLLARLSRGRRLNRGLLLALRNTVRRPARFWLSVGLLASAGAVFIAGMSLGAGTNAIDEDRIRQRTWDVEVQLDRPAPAERVAALAQRIPGVTGVTGLAVAKTGVAGPGRIPVTRTYPDQGHGSISVVAIPTGASLFSPPATLLEGRWLNPAETGAVVLNQITRDRTVPGVHAGDTIQLFLNGQSTTWRIAGIAQEREGGAGGVYTTAAGLAAATGQPPQANLLRIATAGHDEHTRQTVADAVDTALTGAGLQVATAASVSRTDAISAGHLGPVILILLAVALPLGVVGAIGLASTMSANILDRTREFGIMHAIGARPRTVRRIVIAEGVLLALTSYLVAIIPALALTKLLGTGFGTLFMSVPLPFRISPLAAAIWLALAVLGAILATDTAATRASRLTVRQALTYL